MVWRNGLRVIVIDAEWDGKDVEVDEKVIDGNYRKIHYKRWFIGLWDGLEYIIFWYKGNKDIKGNLEVVKEKYKIIEVEDQKDFTMKFMEYIEQLPEQEIYIYSYFSSAELQFFKWVGLSQIKDVRIISIKKIVDLDISLKDKVIYFRDIQRITNTSKAEELFKSFSSINAKEVLKKYNMDRANLFANPIDQVIEYNEADCKAEYESIIRFYIEVEEVFNALNLKFDRKEILKKHTLGAIAMEIIKQMTIRNGEAKYFVLTEKKEYEEIVNKDDINFNQEIIKQFDWIYRGGGIIHNLMPLFSQSKMLKDVYMYDVKSLYPHSGIIASYELDMDTLQTQMYLKWKPIDTHLKEIINNRNIKGFVKVRMQIINKECLLLNQLSKTVKGEVVIERMYAGEIYEGGIYLDILREVLDAEWVDPNSIEYKSYIIWNKPDQPKIKSIKEFYEFCMEQKEIASQNNNIGLRTIYKMLSNITYGKLVQGSSKYKFYLYGALITAISSLIMIKAYKEIRKRGYKVYHLATDSIITDMPLEQLEQFNTWEYLGYSMVTTSKEVFESEFKEPMNVYIIKLKTYIISKKPIIEYQNYDELIKDEPNKIKLHAISKELQREFVNHVLNWLHNKEELPQIWSYRSYKNPFNDEGDLDDKKDVFRKYINKEFDKWVENQQLNENKLKLYKYLFTLEYIGEYQKERMIRFVRDNKFSVEYEDWVSYKGEIKLWTPDNFEKRMRDEIRMNCRIKKVIERLKEGKALNIQKDSNYGVYSKLIRETIKQYNEGRKKEQNRMRVRKNREKKEKEEQRKEQNRINNRHYLVRKYPIMPIDQTKMLSKLDQWQGYLGM